MSGVVVLVVERRAARCAAPTEPHPPRFAWHLPLKGKAFRRPQGSPLRRHPNVPGGRVWDPPLRRIQNGCIFLVGAGHWPALQWKPDRDVSSKNPGAETRPQLQQFPSYPGPSGAGWGRTQALLILRAGNFMSGQRGDSRNGGLGESRHGERSSPLRRPPAILWFLSHRWERNSPRRAKPCDE